MPPDNPVPTPVDPAAADVSTAAFNRQSEAVSHTNEMLGMFDSMSQKVQTVLSGLSNKLVAAGVDLKNLGDPASIASSKFGLLATAVVGATESFKGLSNIDSSGLSTFSEQLTDIKAILTGAGTAGGIAKDVTDKLVAALAGANRPVAEIKAAIAGGADVFFAYAKNVLTSADNSLRLQTAMIQLSASTGNLGTLMRDAGEDLSGMNDLLAKQSEMLSKAGADTKLGAAQLQQYWAQLGTVPGVLEEMTVNLTKGDEAVNILSASVQLATGSGRKYTDVISDLRKAVVDYGFSTSETFTFTARIAEISQKVKAPMEDVRNALLSSADAFKTFADAGASSARQSEGFANIMNTYVDSLKAAGLSSHAAVSLTNQMTNSVKDLRIEQKAFLSQQTGGPGGLMGGFQIDKMLREGKTDQVFDLVRQQMQKQFGGKIATLEEATKSPAAALQLEKQVQLLQKGPLGGMAKTDQDAYRILEAFKDVSSGRRGIQGLSQSAAADQVSKGAQIQNLSNTPLSSLRSTLEGIRYTVNVANLGTVQKGFSAGAGIPLADTDTAQQKNMRAGLAQTTPTDRNATVGTMAGGDISKMQDWLKNLDSTSKTVLEGLNQAIKSGKIEDIETSKQQVRKEIDADKGSKESQLKQKALDSLQNVQSTSKLTNFKTSQFSSLEEPTFGEANASQMVGKAARTGAAITTPTAPVANNTGATPVVKGTADDMNFKVNVSAICTVCRHNLETSEQSRSVNPTVGS